MLFKYGGGGVFFGFASFVGFVILLGVLICYCCLFRRIFSLLFWVNFVCTYDFACFSLNYRICSRNG